ncbi:MAG: TasA family protein [Candidatus Andersenbacteria bacterium]
MKRIVMSVFTIFAMVAVVSGATLAAFSSTATVENNTFATGTLEIRVNGQPTIAGFNVANAAPGTCESGSFDVNNYGAPWFAGPSTLAAKTLELSVVDQQGSTDLFNELTIEVMTHRGGTPVTTYSTGALSGLTANDLFGASWSELIAGSSQTVQYEVCLPSDADNSVQGESTNIDFELVGTTGA